MNDGKKGGAALSCPPTSDLQNHAADGRGPAKPRLCGERTSDEVTEPCRKRQGEGYAIREDESIVSEHKFCVLRDWGSAPTSMKQAGSV